MTDTPPEIAAMVRDRLMALSGAERFRLGSEMFDVARRMLLASLPADLSQSERKRLLYQRIYGETLPIHVRGSMSMKITKDLPRYAAEHGLAEEEALQPGLADNSKEFVEQGAEVYVKA